MLATAVLPSQQRESLDLPLTLLLNAVDTSYAGVERKPPLSQVECSYRQPLPIGRKGCCRKGTDKGPFELSRKLPASPSRCGLC